MFFRSLLLIALLLGVSSAQAQSKKELKKAAKAACACTEPFVDQAQQLMELLDNASETSSEDKSKVEEMLATFEQEAERMQQCMAELEEKYGDFIHDQQFPEDHMRKYCPNVIEFLEENREEEE